MKAVALAVHEINASVRDGQTDGRTDDGEVMAVSSAYRLGILEMVNINFIFK